jgi:hypothetical protein
MRGRSRWIAGMARLTTITKPYPTGLSRTSGLRRELRRSVVAESDYWFVSIRFPGLAFEDMALPRPPSRRPVALELDIPAIWRLSLW